MKPSESSPKQLAVRRVVALIAIAISFAVGFLVGRQGGTPDEKESAGPDKPAPAAAPAASGMSSEDIAKSKNVPAVYEDPGGDYQLVAVIEGVEANQKLNQNLQLVGAQRQQLLSLSQQFDGLPADAAQQRELIAGEINSVRQALVSNLQFMAQNYGYTLQASYRLVPHVAELFEVTVDDDEVSTELVQRFEDAGSYRGFEKLREEYILASVNQAEEAKAAEEGADENGADDEEADSATEEAPEPSPEMEEIRKKLIEKYKFDPNKNYQINFEKTALYARPVTQG